MQIGNRFRCYPTPAQAQTLLQWIGCQRYVYNAKVGEDQYFRRFSGHTQVNATDLRTLAYPNSDTLRAMGAEMQTLDLAQDEIDRLVAKHIHAFR